MKYILSLALVAFPLFLYAQAGNIATIAGNGTVGYSGNGGPATAASFNFISDVAEHNGVVYIADMNNNQVRKVVGGIVTIVAGASTMGGYTGDGGPATAANISAPGGLATDAAGNLYISCNCGVRKVSTSGIITTVAGNGTCGHSGDGGPATAAELSTTRGLALDVAGNLYIADDGNSLIRKVSTSGIITTFAGNLSSSYSGDGGPATAAAIGSPYGVAIDGTGAVYISDNSNGYIRKVSTAGIIQTIAGGGGSGYVEGVAATACQLFMPANIRVDGAGNVYLAHGGFHRINKISSSGIITTVAGSGIGGYSGDGGPATLAKLSWPSGIFLDEWGTLYISEQVNNRVRKVNATPYAVSDSFSVFVSNNCSALEFSIATHAFSAGQHVVTSFGNGATLDTVTTLTTSGGVVGVANFSLGYGASGTYTIRHVLYDGTTAVDSVSYSYNFRYCTTMGIKFFNDFNSNCIKESTEAFSCFPVLVKVDSNGVPVDTISTTGGLYYTAYGSPGDVYAFRVISAPVGLYTSCPSTGVIYDTMQYSPSTMDEKMMALSCSSTTGFDFANYLSAITATNMQILSVLVDNTQCTPADGTLTVNFSPKYVYNSASMTPTSTTATSATFDLHGISAAFSIQPFIHVKLGVSGPLLTMGDTVNSSALIAPVTGDLDPSNNLETRNDTARSSFDPNDISVTPQGYIVAGTLLQYTIRFENTGNDTAQNIYVMDTLSDNVDIHTLRVVAASAAMNVSKYTYGGHNIVKFDFPGIKLLDSSHHNLCDGMLVFNIKSFSGLAAGTTIPNSAGIFFDYNPVVLTNTVVNIIPGPLGVNTTSATHASRIYPNPAGKSITIETGTGSYSSFIITNSVGQVVLQNSIINSKTPVDITALPQGLYFVKVLGEQGTEVIKFIKE